MSFLIITLASLLILGLIAALASRGGDDEIVVADNCAGCTSRTDCKLADIMEKKHLKGNKSCPSSVNKE
jgi:hypothetical protein